MERTKNFTVDFGDTAAFSMMSTSLHRSLSNIRAAYEEAEARAEELGYRDSGLHWLKVDLEAYERASAAIKKCIAERKS